jgi:hypothetical protein
VDHSIHSQIPKPAREIGDPSGFRQINHFDAIEIDRFESAARRRALGEDRLKDLVAGPRAADG